MKSFETFLEEKYDEINSNSNNMNEEFENARDSWFENLDIQELMDYGQEFGREVYEDGLKKGREDFIKYITPDIDRLSKCLEFNIYEADKNNIDPVVINELTEKN